MMVPGEEDGDQNEYDALLKKTQSQGAARQPLKSAVYTSTQDGTTQDQAARALELSGKSGVPADTVLRTLPDAEKQAARPTDNEYDALLRNAPKTAQLMEDPIKAAAMLPDLEKFHELEMAYRNQHSEDRRLSGTEIMNASARAAARRADEYFAKPQTAQDEEGRVVEVPSKIGRASCRERVYVLV